MAYFWLMILFTILAGFFTIRGYIMDNWYLMGIGAMFIILGGAMWFVVY